MTQWYEDWFNTEEYLNVYQHRNNADAKKLASLILKNIPLEKGAQILDMACGAGRHSIFFAQQGFKVTAVDLSENLLKVAKKTAEESKVKINFVKSDLRSICFDHQFDLIINLFTSFGYFENDDENYKILESAYQHLEKNGRFVLDFFNKNYLKKNLVKKSLDIINSGYVVQERSIEGKRIVKRININNKGFEKKYMESVRLFTKDELINVMEKFGFFIEKIFGDFDGNAFDLEASPRIIIIAAK